MSSLQWPIFQGISPQNMPLYSTVPHVLDPGDLPLITGVSVASGSDQKERDCKFSPWNECSRHVFYRHRWSGMSEHAWTCKCMKHEHLVLFITMEPPIYGSLIMLKFLNTNRDEPWDSRCFFLQVQTTKVPHTISTGESFFLWRPWSGVANHWTYHF